MTVFDAQILDKAVQLLLEAAQPRKIILFESYATGLADDKSDIDLLVIEDGVPDVPAEIVRLLRILSPLRLPVDLLVVAAADYAHWSDTPGNVIYDATNSGKVLYEAAA
jgi:predicted nucleotidyltransferase